MTLPATLPSVLKRAGLCAALALLGGCTTASHRVAVEVWSPPAPIVGSQQIAAYDAYAVVVFQPVEKAAAATLAQAESATPANSGKRATAAQAILN